MTGCYLLHFDTPYQHAKHYLGYADDIDRRVGEHRIGHGARLTQVIRDAGISFTVARTWPGATRTVERKLKNRKNAPRLCPVCQAMHGGK